MEPENPVAEYWKPYSNPISTFPAEQTDTIDAVQEPGLTSVGVVAEVADRVGLPDSAKNNPLSKSLLPYAENVEVFVTTTVREVPLIKLKLAVAVSVLPVTEFTKDTP